jgi:hypothetical protein
MRMSARVPPGASFPGILGLHLLIERVSAGWAPSIAGSPTGKEWP